MNPQERELLEKTYDLVEQNNKLLRKMRRSAIYSSFLRAFYWIVIIGISLGTYVFLEPYITKIKDVFSTFQSDVSKVTNLTNKVSGIIK